MNADLADVMLQDTADGVVVSLRGELDLLTSPPLHAALNVARWDRVDDVVVDFANVTFCEVHTLGLLARASTRLNAGGRGLRVRGAKPRQARVFQLVGLEHLLAPV
jgi:anti-sigma B factor antagonist